MTSSVTLDAETAATPDGFAQLLKRQLEEEITVYPARAWYPSSIGHPCDRYLVFNFTRWQDKKRHDYVLQAIFGEGNLHQPAIYQRLERMGFEIVRESDRPTQYKPAPGVVISGRPDGRVLGWRDPKTGSGGRYAMPRILEIKTTQSYQFDRLNTIDDILGADQHYIRGYADQGYTYSFLENLPQGLIALKNKATGMLKVIPYELDFDRAEWLLQRVERLQPMVDKVIDPPPMPYDKDVCGRCAFLHLCYPPKDFGAGAQVLEDSQLVEDLAKREVLQPTKKEFEDVDKAIKAKLKQLGLKTGATVMCGPFIIEVSERAVKSYTTKDRVDTLFEFTRVAVGQAAATPAISEAPAATAAAPAAPPASMVAPAASPPAEATLFSEHADKVDAVKRARAVMKKPMSDDLWTAVCREVAGIEDLEQAELAKLEMLRELIDGYNRKDAASLTRINAIVRVAKA
jgi:hypothetical protein